MGLPKLFQGSQWLLDSSAFPGMRLPHGEERALEVGRGTWVWYARAPSGILMDQGGGHAPFFQDLQMGSLAYEWVGILSAFCGLRNFEVWSAIVGTAFWLLEGHSSAPEGRRNEGEFSGKSEEQGGICLGPFFPTSPSGFLGMLRPGVTWE